MSLTEVYPHVKHLAIQGDTYLCGQLEIRDFAAFQDYLESQIPHPLDRCREELEASSGVVRNRLLARLQAEDLEWPPQFPCGLSDRLFLTEEGLAFWLFLVLGRHNEMTPDLALTLARSISEEELLSLEKVAYGVTPAGELHRLVYPEDITPDAPDTDWPALVDRVASLHGWTYEYIGTLTLSQFNVALTGRKRGRPAPPDITHMTPAEIDEMLRKQRAAMGMDEPEAPVIDKPE